MLYLPFLSIMKLFFSYKQLDTNGHETYAGLASLEMTCRTRTELELCTREREGGSAFLVLRTLPIFKSGLGVCCGMMELALSLQVSHYAWTTPYSKPPTITLWLTILCTNSGVHAETPTNYQIYWIQHSLSWNDGNFFGWFSQSDVYNDVTRENTYIRLCSSQVDRASDPEWIKQWRQTCITD